MPQSMTGFGRGEATRENRRLKVEIKAVNHRYSDIIIKLPRFLNPFEDRLRKRLSQDITRGKVDVWVNIESFAQDDITVKINEPFADAYMTALKTLSTRYRWGDTVPAALGLELLAKNPDVISFDKYEAAMQEDDTQTQIWETLMEALENALAGFNAMRKAEGAALTNDICEKVQRIKSLITSITARLPIALEEQAAKTRERIAEMLENLGHKLDEGRFLTEIAILADRSAIDEELARLDSHLSQLATILQEPAAVGRKLDFLVQELNREANTIGSKSQDAELAKLVVELKSEIEKIREQVQNIE